MFIIIVGNPRWNSSTTYHIKSRRNQQWVSNDGLVYEYLLSMFPERSCIYHHWSYKQFYERGRWGFPVTSCTWRYKLWLIKLSGSNCFRLFISSRPWTNGVSENSVLYHCVSWNLFAPITLIIWHFFAAMGFHAFDIRKHANIFFLIFETYEREKISNVTSTNLDFLKITICHWKNKRM